MVKPFGPHHCIRRSRSVQALNTMSRGASNTRVMTNSRSAAAATALLFPATLLLLRLKFPQVIVQAIEAFVPESAVAVDPVGDVLERPGFEPARPPLRLAAARDQPGAFQYLEVLGDRRQAHRERRGKLRDRSLAQRQARKYGAPGGIGERRKCAAEAIGHHD